MPPVPLGIARTTPPAGVPNMYAVNIGSGGAAHLAFRAAELSDELADAIKAARSLSKYARRLPHLWP